MFGHGRLIRLHKPRRNAHSITGMALTITGDLDADTPVRIDGTIEGDVRGTLVTICRTASVKGSIYADTVRVAGRVSGLIKAGAVVITKHAHITGGIICETLEVEPGADIGARCKTGQLRSTRPDNRPCEALWQRKNIL